MTGRLFLTQRWLDIGRDALSGAVDLVYPPCCVLTGEPLASGNLLPEIEGNILASACRPYCSRCGASVGPHLDNDPAGCSLCREERYPFEQVVRLGSYDGDLANACRRIKLLAGYQLANLMADLLWEKRGSVLQSTGIDLVVPVPLDRFAAWRRGYNQSAAIAKRLAKHLQRPMSERAIIRQRRGVPQHHLSLSERRQNVRGAFAPGNDRRVRGARVLLVDDVLTTGATCRESAKALKQGGAASVHVAVLARGGPGRDVVG